MEMGRGFVRLEGNDSETRNHLEVAHIGGRNPVAKLERRDTDQQVGEGHTDALGSILAVDLTGPESPPEPSPDGPAEQSSVHSGTAAAWLFFEEYWRGLLHAPVRSA